MSWKKRCIMKNKKTSNRNNNRVTKQQAKKTLKELAITLLKGLCVCTFIYLVMFAIIVVITHFSNKAHGYETSDTTINNYITAIIENDESGMEKCIYTESNSYPQMYEIQEAYAKLISNMDVEINKENIEIETSECDDVSKIAETLSDDTTIKHAYDNNVYISYTETINGDTFDGLIQYVITTYQVEEKWYVFSIEQNDTVTRLAEGNQYMYVGDETLGVIALNENWTPVNMEPLEGTESMFAYESPDGNAVISVSAINSELSLDDYIANFTTSLDDLNIEYIIENRNLNATDMIYIYYTSKNKNGEEIYQCTWLFEAPMRDGYIHCITLDCTRTGIYATSYIDTYVY